MVINENMARRFWPDEDPIGQRVTMRDWGPPLTGEIVGVAADVKANGLDSETRPMIYWAYPQFPIIFNSIVVRAEGNPLGLVGALKSQIWSVDPLQPISSVATMDQVMADSVAPRRFNMLLIGVFAAIALALAAIGIYGVISYTVSQRTHEIGVRVALGAREGFYSQAFAQVKAIPGVQEIGTAVVTPLTGNNWTAGFERPEQPVSAGERPPEVGWQLASNGYFKALQIPLIAGRLFDDRDVQTGPPVAIISEAIQKRFFPNESAIGKRVKQGDETLEIVGVVGNIRRAGLRDEPRADMYFPFERNKPGQITLFVRTAADPEKSLPAIKAAITRIEPNAFLSEEQTLAHVASESERVTRVVLWLLGVFAVTSLALAAIGIYGVMSYAVRQRTREIGTRIALGATRGNILWLVLHQGAVIAAVGTVVGLATGLATTRFLASILYGVTGSDPLTLSVAVVLLVMTIMLASYIPARRAASVDPAKTLAEQ